MEDSTSLRPTRALNAAELAGTHNRVSISPDIVRTLAHELGYSKHPAFVDGRRNSLPHLYDLSDILELMLRAKLPELCAIPSPDQQLESQIADNLLQRIFTHDFKTRSEIHDLLPSETVVLFKMGPPRLWGYAVRQRLAADAEQAIPASYHQDPTGPHTNPQEAWLGAHVTDATDLTSLVTQVSDVPVDEDRYQRLRLGMSLVDGYDQVWSSARGHWRVSTDTRYIVPSRYGWCPYVFRVADDGWRRDEFDGSRDRYMATRGYFIDVKRQRLMELGAPNPDNAWRPEVRVSEQPPTDRDLEIASVLSDSLIALGAPQRNPVIRLRQRGRNLF